MRPARALTPWRKTLRAQAKGQPTGRRASHQPTDSRARLAHPLSGTGTGTDAAGVAGGLASVPTTPACQVCGDPAVPGDDVALCRVHGGLEWADFDEAAWLAGREAC